MDTEFSTDDAFLKKWADAQKYTYGKGVCKLKKRSFSNLCAVAIGIIGDISHALSEELDECRLMSSYRRHYLFIFLQRNYDLKTWGARDASTSRASVCSFRYGYSVTVER